MALEENPTTILIVEDDVHLLSGIKDILELEEYRVLTAQNGLEGLDILHETPDDPPAVIVSDIMMPHMDGFTFLEEVRKEDRWVTVPFIFLTAKGEKTDRHRGSLAGADVYLTKPFDAEDLLVSVSSCLKRYGDVKRVKQDEIGDVKNKILTILNHEFRTPLTLVVAYADMLKDYDGKNMEYNEIRTFLHGVNAGAERLQRLIENFITLVELDSGDAAKTFSWRQRPITDMEGLARDALRQVEQPEQRPRQFNIHIDPELPNVTADSQFLTIIMRELLDNAAKFSHDNAKIDLDISLDGDYYLIAVTDEGRGIASAYHDDVWLPFFQIDREEFEDQGSGSGLAIIDGLVEIHGGSRNLVSAPQQGCTVTLRLPIDPPHALE
jgi:two-component system sensor histidine kinase/response regulator